MSGFLPGRSSCQSSLMQFYLLETPQGPSYCYTTFKVALAV